MGIVTASILDAKVMHKRLVPKQNGFTYRVYYLAIPLAMVEDGSLDAEVPLNRFGLHSFYVKDHGYRDGSSLMDWAKDMLERYGIEGVEQITLICMPRILGYVFNPVSFWVCYASDATIRAVICEVNNTFGETHSYICADDHPNPITPNLWLHTKKLFHVSPFLTCEGRYDFRFDLTEKHCRIQINHRTDKHLGAEDTPEDSQQLLLVTALSGKFHPLSRKGLLQAFISHPIVTFKAVFLIHYQALKLVLKRLPYIPKPQQRPEHGSRSEKTSV